MDPEITKMAFKIGFFVAFVAGVLLFFLKPGTDAFVVDVLALVAGLVFMAVVAIVVRRYR